MRLTINGGGSANIGVNGHIDGNPGFIEGWRD
jgi:hypothetical protein